MQPKHKGCHSELSATLWLINRGYDVFRNVSQHGLADIIAMTPDGEVIKIDVKTGGCSTHKNGKTYMSATQTLSPAQKAAGVKLLWVLPDGTCCWTVEEVKAYYGA